MANTDMLQQFGDIRITRRLSNAGAFMVFEGYHEKLGRDVAVKFLPRQFAQRNPKFAERFRTNAQLAARLTHPGVVRTYYTGEADGNYFVVMELVQGRSLEDAVRETGPLDPAQVARIGTAVAEALYYANSTYAMLHRDINPGHIMLANDGSVKLVGLGLAKTVDTCTAIIDSVKEADEAGKPNYMAPDCLSRNTAPDVRSDIYSLGATLYYALTGQKPYGEGSVLEVIERVVKGERKSVIEALPDAPRWLAHAIEQMMKTDPDKRPPTYAAVARLLNPPDSEIARLGDGNADLSATADYERPQVKEIGPRKKQTTATLKAKDVADYKPPSSLQAAKSPMRQDALANGRHPSNGGGSRLHKGAWFLVAVGVGILLFGVAMGMLIAAALGVCK